MVLSNISIAISKFSNFPARVQDGCMIPATTRFTNFRQRMVGQFLGQTHRHLPWSGDASVTPFGENIRNFNVVVLGNRSLDVFDSNLAILNG